MPLSSHAEFPGYPGRQRWNLVAARSSFSKDTAEQVGPDGRSSPGIIHLPFLGVKKEAHTSCTSFSWLSTPGTMVNSCHQLGVLYAQAFQVTHFCNSSMGGSGEGTFKFSSPKLSADPWRKQVTSGSSSGGSSK